MNYSELSDFEINRRVAETVGMVVDGCYEHSDSVIAGNVGDSCEFKSYDYCNNPSDAWSVIEKMLHMGVTLVMNAGGVMTSSMGVTKGGVSYDVDGSPFRAAMIVFLIMKESE